VRARISQGRLPRAVPDVEMRVRAATGASCCVCDCPIDEYVEQELSDPRTHESLRFHTVCLFVWQVESVRLP